MLKKIYIQIKTICRRSKELFINNDWNFETGLIFCWLIEQITKTKIRLPCFWANVASVYVTHHHNTMQSMFAIVAVSRSRSVMTKYGVFHYFLWEYVLYILCLVCFLYLSLCCSLLFENNHLTFTKGAERYGF